jgi:hypothetical protein
MALILLELNEQNLPHTIYLHSLELTAEGKNQ